MVTRYKFRCFYIDINSLWPSDAILWHRSRSTLVQAMACCLRAPSHYLRQYWRIISEVQWQSHASDLKQEIPQPWYTKINLKIIYINFHINLPGGNELIILLYQIKVSWWSVLLILLVTAQINLSWYSVRIPSYCEPLENIISTKKLLHCLLCKSYWLMHITRISIRNFIWKNTAPRPFSVRFAVALVIFVIIRTFGFRRLTLYICDLIYATTGVAIYKFPWRFDWCNIYHGSQPSI